MEKNTLILESEVLQNYPGGCPVVRLRYQVGADQNAWMTEEEIPFLVLWDAQRFARKYSANREVSVRVHTEFSAVTRFYAFGQK